MNSINTNLNFVIDKIEKLEIKNKDTDIVVISFNPGYIDIDTAGEIFQTIKRHLPNHNVIGKLIEDYDMSVENIDYLINKLQNIKKEKANENIH